MRTQSFLTLLDYLEHYSTEKPNDVVFSFLDESGFLKSSLTFIQVRDLSRTLAKALLAHTKPKTRVALVFSQGLEFIIAFWACLYAGVTAVPIPPPSGTRQKDRVLKVLRDAEANICLSHSDVMNAAYVKESQIFSKNEIHWLDIDKILYKNNTNSILPNISQDDVAFLQYTSGSTSVPKGVMVSHKNILYNQKIITSAFCHDSSSKIVGWLPFTHDMGLIGNILHPIYIGASCTLFSPLSFLKKPLMWLRIISSIKATTSGGPNFGYQLCVDTISEDDLKTIDLSSWKVAFNGSEMVSEKTINLFIKKFEVCGFNPHAFLPCYGLAESTLFVTSSIVNTPIKTTSNNNFKHLNLVSLGKTYEDDIIKIVDPNSHEVCTEKQEGEIWIKSDSVCKGYYNKKEETEETFTAFTSIGEGPFLRTGDIGFIEGGDLYFTARRKNLIIIRGKNFYPEDIELSINELTPILSNCRVAAFSITSEVTESLIIFIECKRNMLKELDFGQLTNLIQNRILQEFQVSVEAVWFLKPNSIPRTTSGKLQYHECRRMFKQQDISPLWKWEELQYNNFSAQDFITSLLKLNESDIEIDQPLINYGLDSLKGTQILHYINENTSELITFQSLMNGMTLRTVKEHLIKFKRFRIDKEENFLREFESSGPLSYQQENLSVIQNINPNDTSYNIPILLKMEGTLNKSAFIQTIEKIVDRHQIFRSSIKEMSKKLIQEVSQKILLPFEEVSSLQEIYIDIKTPFDLSNTPLFRIKMYQETIKVTYILLNFHHSIFDGWSMRVFLEDFLLIYKCIVEDKELVLEAIPGSYIEFANTQRSLDYSKMLKYWLDYLKGDIPALRISEYHRSDPNITPIGGKINVEISGKLLLLLKECSKKLQSTVFITLFTIFHITLNLYSGEDIIIVGYPAANRRASKWKQIIGFFVNTLVNKTIFCKHTTFQDILKQCKDGVLNGSDFEELPFQHLVDNINPLRSSDSSPIFQAMFVMQDVSTEPIILDNLKILLQELSPVVPIYDLVLQVEEKDHSISLIFEYRADKLPDSVIQEFKDDYLATLVNCLKNPYLPISNFSCRTYSNIFDSIKQQAQIYPHNIAIKSISEEISYNLLIQYTASIAQTLIDNGLIQGQTVGLITKRTPFTIAAILGIMQAGGVYVPIDPNYPSKRIEFILKDANISFLLTDSELLADYLSSFKGNLVIISKALKNKSFKSNLCGKNAYIMYTSGSTGNPKGVVVSHDSLLYFTKEAIKLFDIKNPQNIYQFASICWDTSSEEIFPCLLTGGTLILRSDAIVEPFDMLLKNLEQEKIEICNLPTSYWNNFLMFLMAKNLQLPKTLKLIIVGGEKINQEAVKNWQNYIGGKVKLLNTYGSTETTSISAAFDLSNWNGNTFVVPIGQPLNGTEFYILDKYLRPVPTGVSGQLYIGGRGVAVGYINNQLLNNQKFLKIKEDRVYNTEDIAYKDFEGIFYIKGREGNNIKRRGFLICLDEIEHNLKRLSEVKDCLVHSLQSESNLSPTIRAYIILSQFNSSEILIRKKLRQVLPEYMIPDVIIILDEFLYLFNGKIDHNALNQLQPFYLPETQFFCEFEEKISTVWKQVLSTEARDLNTSFFDFGGNSLLLLNLHQKLEEIFNIKFPIASLFDHYTIGEQAMMIKTYVDNKNM